MDSDRVSAPYPRTTPSIFCGLKQIRGPAGPVRNSAFSDWVTSPNIGWHNQIRGFAVYSALYPRLIRPNIGGLNRSGDSDRNSARRHRITPPDIGGLMEIREFRTGFRSYCTTEWVSERGYRCFDAADFGSELYRVCDIPNSDSRRNNCAFRV